MSAGDLYLNCFVTFERFYAFNCIHWIFTLLYLQYDNNNMVKIYPIRQCDSDSV